MTRRVLLSAYACEPDQGSEPAVGWGWATALPRLGLDVTVLTRANNLAAIQRALAAVPEAVRPHVVPYDLPRWLAGWKRGRRGIHLYYLLWQWGAYRTARRLHRRQPFDLVHHVTFVSVHQPSFMGLLGTRFWFGPLAGGDRIPRRLRAGLGMKARIAEGARDLANATVKFGPFMRWAFARAERIVVTSEATRDLLPRTHRERAEIALAIGLDDPIPLSGRERTLAGPFRVLMVGRLHPIKGGHLGLAAFAAMAARVPDTRLTVIGSGPDGARLARQAGALGVADRVRWVGHLPRPELLANYGDHDVLLFPALRDSGGLAVLEAMAAGLPVVCLDLGGPGRIVTPESGVRVAAADASERAVIDGLASALAELAAAPDRRRRLGQGAVARARDATVLDLARRLYGGLVDHADEAGR